MVLLTPLQFPTKLAGLHFLCFFGDLDPSALIKSQPTSRSRKEERRKEDGCGCGSVVELLSSMCKGLSSNSWHHKSKRHITPPQEKNSVSTQPSISLSLHSFLVKLAAMVIYGFSLFLSTPNPSLSSLFGKISSWKQIFLAQQKFHLASLSPDNNFLESLLSSYHKERSLI